MSMKIKLGDGHVAARDDIVTLQELIGEPVNPEYVRFISGNDGAKPETNLFKVGETNDAGVDRFIPISEIPKEMTNIENLPSKAFPIAWASCGNYVFLDQGAGGSVFFWDHELADDPAVKLADSFDAFLESLEPFDINSIELEPGQVEEVWIDPDFLKSLKGNG
jgi:SMI1 / KNR4 family (SUKH-1)